MDFGKYKYELAKKDKQAKKKQHAFQLKEMRYRPKIDEHDYQFKTRHVREFMEAGSKVRVFVMFRGREMTHQEFGRVILDRVAKDLEDIAQIDVPPKMEGYTMSMILSPKPGVVKKLLESKSDQKKDDREEGAQEGAETNAEKEDDQAVRQEQ
jgi:translation initiation factor IF-3